MNKYASGYALIRLMSVVGSVFIAVSIIGGVVIGVSSPRGMGGYGFVVAILGAFQGLMILGVGAIGEAILDGSVAQQDLLSNHISKSPNQSSKQADSKVEDLLRLILGNSLGKPGMAFQEQFMGVPIFKSDSGAFIANDAAFETIELARGRLAKENILSSDSAEEFGDFAIIGAYKIPRVDGRYLVNGMEFDSIENLKREINMNIASGYTRRLEKYLV